MLKKESLNSLHGLRVLVFYSLFAFHAGFKIIDSDVGARAVEFFFIMSGFLMFYNHFETSQPTFKESFRILKKKVISFYPVHILTFILSLGLFIDQLKNISHWKINLYSAIMNLLLVQSWSDNSSIFFSFNGVSWFLSSILFCYALTPLLFLIIRKTSGQFWRCTTLFTAVFIILVFIESLPVVMPDSFHFSVHTNPVVRSLDYMLGCITGYWYQELSYDKPLFLKRLTMVIDKHHVARFVLFSILEIGLFFLYSVLAMRFDTVWLRAYYIPITCLIVFTISKGFGAISFLFKNKLFAFIDKIELEQFLFHQICLLYLSKAGLYPIPAFLLAIVITYYVSLAVHHLTSVFLKRKSKSDMNLNLV